MFSNEQIHKLELKLLEKQFARLDIIDGLKPGDAKKALDQYERTKAWAIMTGLGKFISANAIDPEFFQTFSDWYKDVNGFRPRGWCYDECVKVWNSETNKAL